MATDTRVIRHTLPCGCSWGAFKPATYCEEGAQVHPNLAYEAGEAAQRSAGPYADEFFANAIEDWRYHFGTRRTPDHCRRHHR